MDWVLLCSVKFPESKFIEKVYLMLEPKTFAFTSKWLAPLAKRFLKLRGQKEREIKVIAADFGWGRLGWQEIRDFRVVS